MGKYAVKAEMQSLLQGLLDLGSEGIQYSFSQRLRQGQQTTITFYPNTEIKAAG